MNILKKKSQSWRKYDHISSHQSITTEQLLPSMSKIILHQK